MSNREEIPAEVRRMKTSGVLAELVTCWAVCGCQSSFVCRWCERASVLSAELDRRVPPSEAGT